MRIWVDQSFMVVLLVIGVNLVAHQHGWWNLVGAGCLGLFAGRTMTRRED